MNEKLKEKVKESLSSVLPITLIVLVLSVTLVPMEIGTLALFLTGAVLLIVGMGFFQLGAEMSMTPLGEGVGKTLAKREKVLLVVLVAFALGTIITIAEPDLQVLANQVASIPNNVLIWTVAVGVGVFLALAVLRILFRVSLAKCLLAAYALLFVLTLFSPKEFLAVAFDAGGVTTGPITVPFIMALGVGVSAIRSTQGHDDDSFGLVALCSIGPVLAVLLLGIFYSGGDAGYTQNMGLDEDSYGVQSSAADKAGTVQEKTAFLPDYSFAGSDSAAGTSVSGIAGAAIVAAAAALICGVGGICRHKKNHSQ